MELNSIEDVRKHFGISETSVEEIRKILVSLLAQNHPDKTGGQFKSKYQEEKYNEIDTAIKFLENFKQEVTISNQDISAIITVMKEHFPQIASFSEQRKFSNETPSTLENKINSSIVHFQKRHLFPKISTLVISGVLTILWTFPTIVQGHLILNRIINLSNPIFSIFWCISLIMTGFFWIIVKTNEKKDETLKKSYNLESTQNNIFKLFLTWTRIANSGNVDINSHRTIIRFTKDDLVDFILNRYLALNREFRDHLHLDLLYLYFEMSSDKNKETTKKITNRSIRSNTFSLPFIASPGEIDIDLAQNIAELIITRILARKIVKLSDKQSYSDTFEFLDPK